MDRGAKTYKAAWLTLNQICPIILNGGIYLHTDYALCPSQRQASTRAPSYEPQEFELFVAIDIY